MIKLVPDPTFEHDVAIAVPGIEAPAMAKLTFRALPRERVLALLIVTRVIRKNWLVRAYQFLRMCVRARGWITAVDILDELIASWQDINVPYSKENLRLLLTEYPGARESIFFAYFTGLREAKLKN